MFRRRFRRGRFHRGYGRFRFHRGRRSRFHRRRFGLRERIGYRM